MQKSRPLCEANHKTAVGKTWLMKEFGQNYYERYVYFNFDEEEELKSIFEVISHEKQKTFYDAKGCRTKGSPIFIDGTRIESNANKLP